MTASEWRFLVDENVDPDVVDELCRRGVDAEWVPDVLAFGDDDLLSLVAGVTSKGV